jgi:hypothetical protein
VVHRAAVEWRDASKVGQHVAQPVASSTFLAPSCPSAHLKRNLPASGVTATTCVVRNFTVAHRIVFGRRDEFGGRLAFTREQAVYSG